MPEKRTNCNFPEMLEEQFVSIHCVGGVHCIYPIIANIRIHMLGVLKIIDPVRSVTGSWWSNEPFWHTIFCFNIFLFNVISDIWISETTAPLLQSYWTSSWMRRHIAPGLRVIRQLLNRWPWNLLRILTTLLSMTCDDTGDLLTFYLAPPPSQ